MKPQTKISVEGFSIVESPAKTAKPRPRPLHVYQCRETGFSTGITVYLGRNPVSAYLAMDSTHEGVAVNPVGLMRLLLRIQAKQRVEASKERAFPDLRKVEDWGK